ncbi:MAG: hypothetical protein K6G61_07770 [Solobacterium sp.]|nr:hypothetical protein [Solobacterium sp.]
MNTTLKTWIASAVLVSLAGCSGQAPGSTEASGVNMRTKFDALVTSEKELGLADKYASITEIPDGKIDEKLVGTWVSADGDIIYTYNADGTASAELAAYDLKNDVTYTCIEIDGKKVVCEDTVLDHYDTDGNITQTPVVAYSTYEVTDNALYISTVENTDETFSSYTCSVIPLYKADEQGNAGEAIKASPIAIETYYGTWKADKGTFTISADGLVYDGGTYALSLDSMNRLVAEKDGKATAYKAAVYYVKMYDPETKTIESEGYTLNLNYTGEDENDKPNLLPLLDDWKTDFGWNDYLYSGTFRLGE